MAINIQITGTSPTTIFGDGVSKLVNITNRVITPELLTITRTESSGLNNPLIEGSDYEIVGSDINFYSVLQTTFSYTFAIAAETTIAKIQVRRGDMEDLPLLSEGELGYATDARRLFIGNVPMTFVGDGVSTRFSIQDRDIITNHLNILVNGAYYEAGVEYSIDGVDLVFFTAPLEGDVIEVSSNTEIQTQQFATDTSRATLLAGASQAKMGVSFNLNNYNTAIFDYSLKSEENVYRLGTLRIITNGTENGTHISDISTGVALEPIPIVFDALIENNRLHLIYDNNSLNQANFYYSVKLWNTI